MKTTQQNKSVSYRPSGNLKDIIGSTCEYKSVRCRITSTYAYIDDRWPGDLHISIYIVPIEEHNFDEDELSYMRSGVSVDELSCFHEKPREDDVTSASNSSEREKFVSSVTKRAKFVSSATKKAIEKRKEQGFPMTYKKREMYELGFYDAVELLLGNIIIK
tara:strand:- start:176 stop:658 length:483 start_codon:yes stop_codon:yes gene_type:complete